MTACPSPAQRLTETLDGSLLSVQQRKPAAPSAFCALVRNLEKRATVGVNIKNAFGSEVQVEVGGGHGALL